MPKTLTNNIESRILSRHARPEDVVKEIIDSTGIPYPTLHKYRLNQSQPKIENCFKLAEFFGCSIENLFDRKNTKRIKK